MTTAELKALAESSIKRMRDRTGEGFIERTQAIREAELYEVKLIRDAAEVARAYLRLVEAGDKMADVLFHKHPCEEIAVWNAAKEGK